MTPGFAFLGLILIGLNGVGLPLPYAKTRKGVGYCLVFFQSNSVRNSLTYSPTNLAPNFGHHHHKYLPIVIIEALQCVEIYNLASDFSTTSNFISVKPVMPAMTGFPIASGPTPDGVPKKLVYNR